MFLCPSNPTGVAQEGTRGLVLFLFTPSVKRVKRSSTDGRFIPLKGDLHTKVCNSKMPYRPPIGACLHFFCREKGSAVPFPRRQRSRILCTHEAFQPLPLSTIDGMHQFTHIVAHACNMRHWLLVNSHSSAAMTVTLGTSLAAKFMALSLG